MNSLVHSREALVPVADLSALIAKLEAAEEGSRELDAEICIALQYGGPNSDGATNVRTDDEWEGDLLFEQGSDECCNPIPALTTSLDAAGAMAERLLPEVFWEMSCRSIINGQKQYGITLWPEDLEAGMDGAHGHAQSPALATCIAILRAHASRAVEGGK